MPHSKAPWKLVEDDSVEKHATTWRLLDADGRYLTYLCEGSDDPALQRRDWLPLAEAEANAWLIAAAPELLAVARRLVALFSVNGEPMQFEWDEIERMAREAVAKAEGK